MKDPTRLVDETESELGRSLLRAAREDAPSRAAMMRTLVAVGAGSAVIGATATAGGAAGKLAGSAAAGVAAVAEGSALALGKWMAVGVLAGLVTAGGATAVVGERSTPQAIEAPATAALAGEVAAPAREVEALRPSPAPDPEQAELPPARASAPAETEAELELELEPVSVESARELAREVAALDAVKRALGSSPGRALALLDTYRRDFPSGRLAPEASYLRMEAHLAAGDRASAEAAAHRIISAYPRSPQAARARDIAGR